MDSPNEDGCIVRVDIPVSGIYNSHTHGREADGLIGSCCWDSGQDPFALAAMDGPYRVHVHVDCDSHEWSDDICVTTDEHVLETQ